MSYSTPFSYGLPFAVHIRYSLAVGPLLLAAQERLVAVTEEILVG